MDTPVVMSESPSVQKIETSIERLPPDSARRTVLEAARDFKASWVGLARSLWEVREKRLFRTWGYRSFEEYVSKEIFIRASTAVKLLHSYRFLEEESPASVQGNTGRAEGPAPSLDAVNALRRVKLHNSLAGEDYERVRQRVIDGETDGAEVRREVSSLLRQKAEADPDRTHRTQTRERLQRFVSTLRSLRRDMDLLAVVPGPLVEETSRLIERLEEEVVKSLETDEDDAESAEDEV